MSKANWVSPDDIILFQPASAEELESKRDDIALIYGDEYDPSIWQWIGNYFPSYWLFYVDDEPVGLIRRDFFKRSVELHGHVRAGYMDKGIQHYAVLACLNHTFFIAQRGPNSFGYPKVTIGVPDDNKFVKGFALKWGFEPTGHREGETAQYVLKREKFIRSFQNEQSQSTQSARSDSADPIPEDE